MGWRKGHSKNDKISDRFNRLLDKTDTCWLWLGDINGNGYGRLQYMNKRMLAHRVSYLLHYGKFNKNMYICHKCDNPKCVNPDHLFLGTQKDNMSDCSNKKRHTYGEKVKSAVLKKEDILEIRKLYSSKKITQQKLSDIYNVSRGHIGLIIQGKRWPIT